MANDADFVAHCQELLVPLGPVRQRRMFGGHGLYVDGHFVAILAGNVLYLKADDDTRAAFEAAGSQPFEFQAAAGQRVVMSYWRAPEDAMESPAQMQHWGRLALGAALRAVARAAARPVRRSAPAKRSQAAPKAKRATATKAAKVAKATTGRGGKA